MVFSSIIFLLYFLPCFLICLFITPKKYRNITILLFSIFFYAWGAPRFIFVILSTTILDFFLVKQIYYSKSNYKKKIWLIISLLINIGLLFYFKYCNFFIDNINTLLLAVGIQEIKWLEVILPIGISFYTFESITYVVDVYRNEHKPLDNFWEYQLYIILFPKLIAGPIIRYHDLADQIKDRQLTDNIDNKLSGFYRFCIGLAKKVIIANSIGKYSDDIFSANISELDTASAWIGMIAYTFQIYFDFSGYSDMAIGLGKIMGFTFPENFNHPYTSQSITEFWRRWHISLGAWMKNYLYIPLGGNRVNSPLRLYFNLWLVFLLSGFWHGASWNFILWGVYHGLLLILERLFLLKIYEKTNTLIRVIINFILVALGWVLFRSATLDQALSIYSSLFSFKFNLASKLDNEFIFYILLATIFSFYGLRKSIITFQNKIYFNTLSITNHLILFGISVFLFTISVTFISATNFNPFIYFRF